MTTKEENRFNLLTALAQAVPNEMSACAKSILADNPGNDDALYVKGLSECIMGDFQQCTTTWSAMTRIDPELYNRDDFAEAVTRKFIKYFATSMDKTGIGMAKCLHVAVLKANDGIELYRSVFKHLDDKVYPDRIEIFKDGQVMHGNTKYANCVSDMAIASFDTITDMEGQLELLRLAADHLRYVNEGSNIPLFNMVVNMLEYMGSEISKRKAGFTDEQLKALEEKWKNTESPVPLLLKARVCQTERLSLLDVRKKRMPKDCEKNIQKYLDQYFAL